MSRHARERVGYVTQAPSVYGDLMDEAAECDRLLLMRDGQLLEQTTPQTLRDRTGEDDLGRAFLAVIEAAER